MKQKVTLTRILLLLLLNSQRANLRNSASNGKYPLEPDILICSDLTLCSLSNPELFYIESADKVARSTSSRSSTNKISTLK